MNNISRLKLRALPYVIVLMLGSSVFTAPLAYAQWIVNDPVHMAETIANEIKRWKQMQEQLEQMEVMLADITKMADWKGSEFKPIAQEMVRELVDLYGKGKSLAYTMQDIDDRFKSQYPGYEKYLEEAQIGNIEDLPKSYAEWAEIGADNARLAIKSAQVNVSAFDKEDAVMKRLLALSQSAKGQVQAIQISNEIAAQQIRQMQNFRQMVANQITLQSNWMAQQNRMEAQGNALREKMNMQRIENSSPKQWRAAERDQMSRDNSGKPIPNW